MAAFYETQSLLLSRIYKRYSSLETANIILCFSRNTHLEIIRQRENDLNFNISLENLWTNIQKINSNPDKISNIVETTGIPKETVRRKVKNLLEIGFLKKTKNTKSYSWILQPKYKDSYLKTIDEEILILSKFTQKFTKFLNLNFSLKLIENEIKSQFCFYWYHFLSCQIKWLRMWQEKLKDTDLLLITLQTTIPTLQYLDKNIKNVNINNIFKIIGTTENKIKFSQIAISATSISEVTGISRATCIRKLEKLVTLGFLLRETKSKRYYVNQNMSGRTKNILDKDYVIFTIQNFSTLLATVINSIIQNNNSVR